MVGGLGGDLGTVDFPALAYNRNERKDGSMRRLLLATAALFLGAVAACHHHQGGAAPVHSHGPAMVINAGHVHSER